MATPWRDPLRKKVYEEIVFGSACWTDGVGRYGPEWYFYSQRYI